MKNYLLMISFITCFHIATLSAQEINADCSPKNILDTMITKVMIIDSYTFTCKKKERFKLSKFKERKCFVKFQESPLKVYYKDLKKGREMLYNPVYGRNMTINPNGLPYFNISIKPHSKLVRSEEHHRIENIGFKYPMKILENLLRVPVKIDIELISWNNNPELQYKIIIHNPCYHKKHYKVKRNENVDSIAVKLGIGPHQIIEMNPSVSHVDDIEVYDKITVPSHYAKKVVLVIDSELYLPRLIQIFDSHGLYEEYIFEKIDVDVTFGPMDFSLKNPGYGFR